MSSVGGAKGQWIEIEDFSLFKNLLEQLDTERETKLVKNIRAIIAKALKEARTTGVAKIRENINNNQRHAEEGLKTHQYSRKSGVLGGNISIFRQHRNGHSSPRPIPPKKNGEPREWSYRTAQVYGYQGVDAQFILWFLENGTRERIAGTGRSDYKGRYRGRIQNTSRNRYFGGTHGVGSIDPGNLRPGLFSIMERVVFGEVIPNINKLYEEISKE